MKGKLNQAESRQKGITQSYRQRIMQAGNSKEYIRQFDGEQVEMAQYICVVYTLYICYIGTLYMLYIYVVVCVYICCIG